MGQSDEFKKQIHALVDAGKSNSQISRIMNCTVGVVAGIRDRYQGKAPKLPPAPRLEMPSLAEIEAEQKRRLPAKDNVVEFPKKAPVAEKPEDVRQAAPPPQRTAEPQEPNDGPVSALLGDAAPTEDQRNFDVGQLSGPILVDVIGCMHTSSRGEYCGRECAPGELVCPRHINSRMFAEIQI